MAWLVTVVISAANESVTIDAVFSNLIYFFIGGFTLEGIASLLRPWTRPLSKRWNRAPRKSENKDRNQAGEGERGSILTNHRGALRKTIGNDYGERFEPQTVRPDDRGGQPGVQRPWTTKGVGSFVLYHVNGRATRLPIETQHNLLEYHPDEERKARASSLSAIVAEMEERWTRFNCQACKTFRKRLTQPRDCVLRASAVVVPRRADRRDTSRR